MQKFVVNVCLAAAVFALASSAAAQTTRYVADTGHDVGGCGVSLATACRSITHTIGLANPGDTILVGPGRYGDLNRNGIIGEDGEENGSPGCGCLVSINRNVKVISTAGAAVTMIDGRTVNVNETVLMITNGGEFGRPGKGFTVTETAAQDIDGNFNGDGIALDSANVFVRGNRVIFTRARPIQSLGDGIVTVNDAPIRIEGNQVLNWSTGVISRGAAVVSKNEVIGNTWGIYASGGTVAGNVVTGNNIGILGFGSVSVTSNAAYGNGAWGAFIGNPFSGSFAKNNMFANGSCGLSTVVTGVKASNNYWGAPTGPDAPPADAACGFGMITSPYATAPFIVKVLKP